MILPIKKCVWTEILHIIKRCYVSDLENSMNAIFEIGRLPLISCKAEYYVESWESFFCAIKYFDAKAHTSNRCSSYSYTVVSSTSSSKAQVSRSSTVEQWSRRKVFYTVYLEDASKCSFVFWRKNWHLKKKGRNKQTENIQQNKNVYSSSLHCICCLSELCLVR